MDFKKLSNIDLLQAYQGYLKLEKPGAVGPDDFDGIFRRAIDECPGSYKVIATEKALLEEIASRWFAEHNQQASPLDHLAELVREHPDLPIVPMVDGEVVAEEGSIRWMGSIGISYIDKVYTGQDRVYFFDDTCGDDIKECLNDSGLFWDTCDLPDNKAKDYYRNLPWKKVIVVNIDLPKEG